MVNLFYYQSFHKNPSEEAICCPSSSLSIFFQHWKIASCLQWHSSFIHFLTRALLDSSTELCALINHFQLSSVHSTVKCPSSMLLGAIPSFCFTILFSSQILPVDGRHTAALANSVPFFSVFKKNPIGYIFLSRNPFSSVSVHQIQIFFR